VNQSGAVNTSALLSEKYKQRKARAVCMLLVAVTEQDCSVGGPN